MRAWCWSGVLLLVFSACITTNGGGGGGTGPSVPVASVTMSPDTATTVPAGTVQLAATPRDGSGNAISGARVDWSSSNSAVAGVSGSGMVTGVAPGTDTITAASGGKSATATITVRNGGPAGPAGATITGLGGAVTLVIPPGALFQQVNIIIEASQGLPSEPRLVSGTAVDIRPSGLGFAVPASLTIDYTLANLPAGARPDSLTLDTYAAGSWGPVPGSAVDTAARKLQAPLGHLSTYGVLAAAGVASVEVLSRKLRADVTSVDLCVNQTYALLVGALDANNNALDNPVTAVSDNPAIATVKQFSSDASQFFVRGVAAGTATITFSSAPAGLPVTANVAACARPVVLTTSEADGNPELYRFAAGIFTRLTNDPALDDLGRVSPDGSTIGWESDRAAPGGDLKLYLMNADGSNVRPLLPSSGYQMDLAWAPSGTALVGRGPKSNGRGGIYRVNADGTGATLLTPDLTTEEEFPAISPNGQYIVFQQRSVSGAAPGPFHLEVMNADGTGMRQLTNPGTASDIHPVFSPIKPGNPEIVFVRLFSNGWNVDRIRFNGNAFGAIGGGTGFAFHPAFCADGEHVMYTISASETAGPYTTVVHDLWIPGAEDPPFVSAGLGTQSHNVSYYPQTGSASLQYGCKP